MEASGASYRADSAKIPHHVTVADVYPLVGTAPYNQPASLRDRWLDLMLTGLMTMSDSAAHEPR